MQSRLLTVEEAREYLNLHPQTVYLMARMSQLPVLSIGRAIQFDKIELDLWIKKKIEENEAALSWAEDPCARR